MINDDIKHRALRAKSRNLLDRIKEMREEAKSDDIWYTFLPCDFGEDVDTAIEELDELLTEE